MNSQTMKLWLQEIVELRDHILRINSPEFRATFNSDNPYPAMLGALEGSIYKPTINARVMLEHIGDIERLERIANAFESLDIDLDEPSIHALEILADGEHKYERLKLAGAISTAIENVLDDEAETEHDAAVEAISAAGFVLNDDDTWTRSDERIITGRSRGEKHGTGNPKLVYAWKWTHEGVAFDSGKSGEFSRLLELIAPKVAEVKA